VTEYRLDKAVKLAPTTTKKKVLYSLCLSQWPRSREMLNDPLGVGSASLTSSDRESKAGSPLKAEGWVTTGQPGGFRRGSNKRKAMKRFKEIRVAKTSILHVLRLEQP